ncbi:MAG TPA: hypothetical protein VMU19_10395 [Bryobacteraceae bacterium]|nr:hypothetical protein [Bryobacteraceae bacterium]
MSRGAKARALRFAAYPAISALLLAPCYWQPRIQAGDLSSHIYNSWLAQLAESGRAPGLAVVRQSTNVLFDLILGGLFRLFGAGPAQRLGAGLAVLVFIWGAFALAAAISGRRPWNLLPSIAVLAYGWVFHMGFFNFYLALGLCFWALALAWSPSPRRLAAAAAILAAAWLAHALPVAWCVGLLAYLAAARGRTPRVRGLLTLAALAAITLARLTLAHAFPTTWSASQIVGITGADQTLLFGPRYLAAMAGLLVVWGALFVTLAAQRGAAAVFGSLPFQLAVLSAGAVFLLPSAVLFPEYANSLLYIAERMSLAVGVAVCAFLALARPRPVDFAVSAAVAALFFVFLHGDESALNTVEDRLAAAVATVPPGDRVVTLMGNPGSRVNALTHMIDRDCIGRCYSFANYEPSTRQFRIRAAVGNPFVVSTYKDSVALQCGFYRVKPEDLPMDAIEMDGQGHMLVRRLEAGDLCGSTRSAALAHRPAGMRIQGDR